MLCAQWLYSINWNLLDSSNEDTVHRKSQGNYTVTLIEGDGIGPEISQSVKDIFAAAKVNTDHPPGLLE